MINKKNKNLPLAKGNQDVPWMDFKTYVNKHEINTSNYTIVYDNPLYIIIKTTKSVIKIDIDRLKLYYELKFNKTLNINEFIQYELPLICNDLFEFGDIYEKYQLNDILKSKFGYMNFSITFFK